MRHETSKSTNRKHKAVYLGIYLAIISGILLLNLYTSQVDFLTEDNTVFIESSSFDPDFSTYELSSGDENLFHYEVSLSKEDFSHLDGEIYRIVLNGVHSNAIRVHFNDQLIIDEGDMEDGFSMLRAGIVHGILDQDWIEDTNTIHITSYASFRTGILNPITISENTPGNRNIGLLRLFNERLVTLGIGLVFMSGLFSLFIYFLNRKDNVFLLWLSLGTLFTGVYLWDYLPIQHLHVDYIFIKKTLLLSLSIGLLFYGLTLYSILKKKYILILPVMQLGYYLFIFFISTNMIDFRSYYDYYFLSIIVIVFSLLLITFHHCKKNNTLFVMLLHFSTIFTLGLLLVFRGFRVGYYSLSTPIFIIVVIGFLPLIITYVLFLEKDIKLLQEKELRQEAMQQAMTDGLTGVYNNTYLKKQLGQLNDASVIAIVDLDNMKPINDTYGHLAGDYVLCYLTDTIKQYIRDRDVLCRYGGDEFVILFKDCSLKEARRIANNIRNHFHQHSISYNGHKLTTSTSIGMCEITNDVDSKSILDCADQELYKAKRKGKNQLFWNDDPIKTI
ncbi:diguanylate cyclase (GGDEF) domain-containing protein [Pelagirhabdus alkalitolerans]|uniref:Diguanylate cyclase (GGDEF) domain-containing protein n=1 Tax=Pelagirhabdus alkalitolerans TaxID=1612202 RepID=A0A1G6GP29_9BACI|nr:GGDEF domain-containing protein [Pelagirhabdus alkalitolerans]SDB83751.1 diguanylate cyclase (GGDEF) domain-containing protein [Pelagirhabdus alkalitolerans]